MFMQAFLAGLVHYSLPIFIVLFIFAFGKSIRTSIKDRFSKKPNEGYKIITDGVLQTAVIESECKCPNCGNESGQFNDKRPMPGYHQYVYKCRNCGTIWQGNIYDMQFNKK